MAEARRRGRPTVTSADDIQRHAMALFLQTGFDRTSMTEIAEAAGVGRTTLFRYFPSKAAIVWAGFDDHIHRLADLLAAQPPDLPTMTAVHTAVVQAFAEAVDDQDVWRQRFQILQETESLAGEAAVHWMTWAQTVAHHVAARSHGQVDDLVTAAVGGAVQAAFLATLRNWRRMNEPPGDVVTSMRAALEPICDGLASLVD